MHLSSLVRELHESVTLKLNEKAVKLADSGRKIFNLTAGQLPFKPATSFTQSIGEQKEHLASYQYSPVAGYAKLREQILDHVAQTRNISFAEGAEDFDCVISNGGKHGLFNTVGTLVDPGDEVILLSPYWISYPEIIKLWGAKPVMVNANSTQGFVQTLDDIEAAITNKTRLIIINSPNNPTGLHYPKEWMKGMAELLNRHPQINVISDEIYFHLQYGGEAPTYFYQYEQKLLDRTVILDGISKSFSSTGLRIGYSIAPTSVAEAISRLQAQTTSGANSLVQKALMHCGMDEVGNYLAPILTHLKGNADTLKQKLFAAGLQDCWYESKSAFYFIIDFNKTPVFAKYQDAAGTDKAMDICNDLLEKTGIAGVPTGSFGLPNAMRISLVLESEQFAKAIDYLTDFLKG